MIGVPIVISAEEVEKQLPMKDALLEVEKAFRHVAEGHVKMPPKIYLDLPQFSGDFRAMPCFDAKERIAGIKWVNSHANNRKKNMPAVMATMLLNDPETGALLAVLDSGVLTAIRTGAAGGVAAKYLSNANASRLTLIGAGMQAYYQALAIIEVRDITSIAIYDIYPQASQMLKARLEGQFKGRLTCASSIENACFQTDIICTTTPGHAITLKAENVHPGVHINAIGADAEGKQEIDPEVLLKSRIVVDEFEQASHSGEVNVPYHNHILTKEQLSLSISDIVSGNAKGRQAKDDITLFDSTGLAIQDLLCGKVVYERMLGSS